MEKVFILILPTIDGEKNLNSYNKAATANRFCFKLQKGISALYLKTL